MPKTTQKTICHDAFDAAQQKRAQHPLQAGAYKLREVRNRVERMQDTMCDIGEYLKKPRDFYPGQCLGSCCTTDDKADWIQSLPAKVADLIGYDLLPAIAALTGDGIAETDVAGELANARASARRLVKDCEAQHIRLQAGTEPEFHAIETGYSDVYALLVDADGIARRALELIDWCKMRASWTGSGDRVDIWV
jgi:hypothetical protein